MFSTAEYIQKVEGDKKIETAPLSHVFTIDQNGKMLASIVNLLINEEPKSAQQP